MKPLADITGTRVFLLEGDKKLTDDIGTIYDIAINKDDGAFWEKSTGTWEKKFNFSLGNNIPIDFNSILFPLKFISNIANITDYFENFKDNKQMLGEFPLNYICTNNPESKKIIITNETQSITINGVFKTGRAFKIQGPDENGEYLALSMDQ